MSTIYRTPNIVIDEFEFHIAVEYRDGRTRRFMRYRPLSLRPVKWSSIADFKGHPPKPWILRMRFRNHMKHIEFAEKSVEANRAKARALHRVTAVA